MTFIRKIHLTIFNQNNLVVSKILCNFVGKKHRNMKNNKRSNVRKTTEQFIEEARQVHGNKYDYSKVEYINANTKVCIICSEHGEFWQTPHNHLMGNGCRACAKLTNEEAKTRILERLEDTDFELVDIEYDFYFRKCKFFVKCKKCGTINVCDWHMFTRKIVCHGCRKYKEYQIAKTCKTTKELKQKYPKTYNWLSQNHFLKEACSHMEWGVGLDKRLIYVYTFDVNNEKYAYVGLTNNIKRRHNEHLNDEQDAINIFCKKHNIVCPLPQKLTDYLSCEIAQIKEEEFKNEYKTYGYNILNRCKCGGLGIIPLEVKRNYTYKELFDIGKRYKTQREWARNEHEMWYYAKQKGWVNEILVKKKNNPVIAMNIRTKETRIYESLSATEKDGFTHGNVCKVCNNKRNFHKGWIFRYIVDGEIENVA